MKLPVILFLIPFGSFAQPTDTLLLTKTEEFDHSGKLTGETSWIRNARGHEIIFTSWNNMMSWSVKTVTDYDNSERPLKKTTYCFYPKKTETDSVIYRYVNDTTVQESYGFISPGGDYYRSVTKLDASGRIFYDSQLAFDGFFKTVSMALTDSIFYNAEGKETERRTYDMIGSGAFGYASTEMILTSKAPPAQPKKIEPDNLQKRMVTTYHSDGLLKDQLTYSGDQMLQFVVRNSYDSLGRLIGSEKFWTGDSLRNNNEYYGYREEDGLLYETFRSNYTLDRKLSVYEIRQKVNRIIESRSEIGNEIFSDACYRYDDYGFLCETEWNYYPYQPPVNQPDMISGGRTIYYYTAFRK